jgi:hypothetical protein
VMTCTGDLRVTGGFLDVVIVIFTWFWEVLRSKSVVELTMDSAMAGSLNGCLHFLLHKLEMCYILISFHNCNVD